MQSQIKFMGGKVLPLVVLLAISSQLSAEAMHTYPNFPHNNWVMIGFPVTPTAADPDAVWGPYFGGNQGNDNNATNTIWRFSRWTSQYDTYIRWGELDRDTNGVYTNLGEPTAIQPGWGYWFYQTHGDQITFSSSGTEADSQTPYLIPLEPPQNNHRGRTMAANPFIFPIDWKNTEVIVHSELEQLDMTVSLLEANEMGLIDQHAYPWNMGLLTGQPEGYLPYNATDGGILPKWQGFWVEQLNRCAQNLITYHVIHPQGDNLCQFQQAHYGRINQQDDLGKDQIPETDRFIMVVLNPENTIEVETKSQSNATVEFANWQSLSPGTTLTNSKGFEIKLVSWEALGNNKYTFIFDVRATIDPAKGWATGQWMEHALFTFGSDKHVTDVLYPGAPNNGNDEDPYIPWSQSGNGNAAAYTALRTIENAIGQASDMQLTLKVPPTAFGLAKSVLNYSPADVVLRENQRDWLMPISIANQSGTLQDNFNGIGIKFNASDGYDINDVAQQSPPDAFLEIYFPHGDRADYYHYWYERPINVCYDLRADSSHKEWKMTVASYNAANQSCTMRWDASAISGEWAVQLLDENRQVLVVDMKTVSEYTLATSAQSYSTQTYYITATFLPVLVNINRDPLPVTHLLLSNHPNPFNATTTIKYQVPQAGLTTLAIYSHTGQLLRKLIDAPQSAGEHTAVWDGRDAQGKPVASGTYLCRLTNGTQSQTLKIVLMK